MAGRADAEGVGGVSVRDCIRCSDSRTAELSKTVAVLCYAKYPPCCMATFKRGVRLEFERVTPETCRKEMR